LVSSKTGLLLAPPLGAVLEKMFSGLDAVLAPLALHARPPGRPLEVRSGEAVACLQLIESGGEALVGACHDGVRLLLFARPVLALLVFASFLLIQSRASVHFLSEKSRLKLARDQFTSIPRNCQPLGVLRHEVSLRVH